MKKKTIRLILTIVMYIGLGIGLLIGAVFSFEPLVGTVFLEDLLEKMHIPLSLPLLTLISLVCIAAAFVVCYLRDKYYKDS